MVVTKTCDPARVHLVPWKLQMPPPGVFFLPNRQRASNLICNNVNDYHSSRNLWDVGVIRRGNFIVWQEAWGESFRGWQAALEGEEDGLSCLSVYLSHDHSPPIPSIHTATFAFLISPRNMWKWGKKKWLVIEITGSMPCSWAAAL